MLNNLSWLPLLVCFIFAYLLHMTKLIAGPTFNSRPEPANIFCMILLLTVRAWWILVLSTSSFLIAFFLIFFSFHQIDFPQSYSTLGLCLWCVSQEHLPFSKISCVVACRAFISSTIDIWEKSLFSSREEIFYSNISGRHTRIFSTTHLSLSSSPTNLIHVTTFKVWHWTLWQILFLSSWLLQAPFSSSALAFFFLFHSLGTPPSTDPMPLLQSQEFGSS